MFGFLIFHFRRDIFGKCSLRAGIFCLVSERESIVASKSYRRCLSFLESGSVILS